MTECVTVGLDLGSRYLKGVIVRFLVEGQGLGEPGWHNRAHVMGCECQPLSRGCGESQVRSFFEELLREQGLSPRDVSYIAATGFGDGVAFRTGYFHTITALGLAASFLCPEASGLVDVGALHGRAARINSFGRVELCRVTSRCAAGLGQFLENVKQHLALAEEPVDLPKEGRKPRGISTLCSVLAESDAINLMNEGASKDEIYAAAIDFVAETAGRELVMLDLRDKVFLTGGLSQHDFFVRSLEQRASASGITIIRHSLSAVAAALGAAIWAGFRWSRTSI